MRRKKVFIYFFISIFVICLFPSITLLKRINRLQSVDYIIDLKKFNISNNNTNAKETTEGINKALEYAKNEGYKSVRLPKGQYSIDTSVVSSLIINDGEKEWTHNRQGIVMQSDIELFMEDAILEMIPTDEPQYSIFTISHCENVKINGGTILGDRENHDFGLIINKEENELESGTYDIETGLPINDESIVRTTNFIDDFKGNKLPQEFFIMPLENTSKNTVDGGVRYIYCFDKSENYLGVTTGGNGFTSKAELLPNTEKIKIAFKNETRLDATYFITTNLIYPSHEFGSGITITASKNVEIDSVTVKNTTGDCLLTMAPPLNVTVDDLKVIDCTFENSRRQGISLVATGENYLIKGCNIGKINGVDPQSGIDIEHYNYVKDVIIEECNFYDNRKWDIINYNGNNIDIKNNKFTGGVGSTFGWNMNIENNEFIYKEIEDNPKIHKGVALAVGTDRENVNDYFNFKGNIIKGYENAGHIQRVGISEFVGNNISDTLRLNISSNVVNNNTYNNSDIRYSTSEAKDEVFYNTNVNIEAKDSKFLLDNSKFLESQLSPKGEVIISNCKIENKEKPFGESTAWWNRNNKIIFDKCEISTKYEKDTEFLESYNSNTLFKECDMDLSRTLFSLNYGVIEFEKCNIEFNEFNKKQKEVDFNKVGYGDKNNYWSFSNCNIKGESLIKINSK